MSNAKRMLGAMLQACYEECTQRTQRTQLTNASKTSAKILAFLSMREGLWITPISRPAGAS